MATSGMVYVRFNSNAQISVPVDGNSSVASIKEIVARRHGVPADQIRLIFAGQELKESMTLADCSVESQSILHAITGRPLTVEAVERRPAVAQLDLASMKPEHQSGEPMSPASPAASANGEVPVKFYVYCKEKQCKGVRPGKLRVRCSTCKESTFLLAQDPTCWEDVLTKGKIKGVCGRHGGCPGKNAEFYFKCSGHPSSESDTCAALSCLRTNTIGVTCSACLEEEDVVLVFPCSVGHCLCLSCFHTYGVTSLNNRDFRKAPEGHYTLPCAAGCEDSLISEIHHFRLLGDHQYERYQRFATEDTVLEIGGLLCPHPNCGNGFIPDNVQRRMQCPFCNFVFCRECKEQYHRGDCGATSGPPPSAVERSEFQVHGDTPASQWEAASRKTVQDTTRPCPKCKVPIEKGEGCMHMTCTQCHFNWCWMCGIEWGRQCQSRHWFG